MPFKIFICGNTSCKILHIKQHCEHVLNLPWPSPLKTLINVALPFRLWPEDLLWPFCNSICCKWLWTVLVNALITTEHNNLWSLWWNLLLLISAIAIQYTCKPEKQISRWDNFMNIYQIFLKFALKKRIFYYLYTTIKLFCKKIRPSMPIFASKKRCSDFWCSDCQGPGH